MKMKSYLKATFLLVVIISVWYLKPVQKSQNVDPLLLQNVEALASYWRGSVDCPVSHDKVEIVYEA